MAQSIYGGLANVLPFLGYGNDKCVSSLLSRLLASPFQRGRHDNILELTKNNRMPFSRKSVHGHFFTSSLAQISVPNGDARCLNVTFVH
jgi:hypothetical protein